MTSFGNRQVNVAVQVLPTSTSKHPYDIVDQAIAIIAQSGVKYVVTPFETVMEGPYDELMAIVKKVQEVCYDHETQSMMCYVKIQSSAEKTVTIGDKMDKYS
jgi:uncharacterized protein YqgV (UPF0045/DUF77 family)